MAFADNAAKAVMSQFVDFASRGENYVCKKFHFLGDASRRSYDIPIPGDAAIVSSEAVSAPSAVTRNVSTLVLDQTPATNEIISDSDMASLLNGAYVSSLAEQRYYRVMNETDRLCINQLFAGAGFDGSNLVNADLQSTAGVVELCGRAEATLVGDGSPRQMFEWAMSPGFFSAFRSAQGVFANYGQAEQGQFGAPHAGGIKLNGIPVMETPGLPSTLARSATASAISSNVVTITLPVGHGFQVGMPITFAASTGGKESIGSATPILSADATTITAALTATDDAANGPGLVTVAGSVAILYNRERAFYAGDLVPRVRITENPNQAGGSALQCFIKSGQVVLEDAARVVLVPAV